MISVGNNDGTMMIYDSNGVVLATWEKHNLTNDFPTAVKWSNDGI